MSNIQFIKTEYFFPAGSQKSCAIISVDGIEYRVEFWGEILEQHSKEDVKQYLFAEALLLAGNLIEARNIISVGAIGEIQQNEDGTQTDTRNWRQNWIDAHPLPPEIITPDNDPLL